MAVESLREGTVIDDLAETPQPIEATGRFLRYAQKVGDILNSYVDGVYTGVDPLGVVVGQVIKDEQRASVFSGYAADTYSVTQFDPINESLMPGAEPVNRTKSQQVAKALGDVTGLGINVIGMGIPQGLCSVYGLFKMVVFYGPQYRSRVSFSSSRNTA
jgi:hypothetical protein